MASIRKRKLPSGKIVWQCDFKDAMGKRRSRQFEKKREADSFMVKARAEISSGTYVHDADSATVKEATQVWLDSCAQRRDKGLEMEAATYVAYEVHVRVHILDPEVGIGDIKLSRLTRKAVNDFRDRLLESGRSEAMTRKVLTTLKLILALALDNQEIAFNPAERVKVRRASRIREEITIPSKADVKRLIDAASEDFRPLLVVSVFCGLRASETRGLRWCDVEFEKGYLHVRQRADRYNQIGEPKSKAGRRSVPMGPFVTNSLKAWRLRSPKGPLDLVFPTKRGTVQSHENVLNRRFKPLCKKLGIERFRWHNLRHFAVSLWIEQAFSVKAIQTFAGHGSVQMTMDLYGHLFPSPDHHVGMGEVERRLLG